MRLVRQERIFLLKRSNLCLGTGHVSERVVVKPLPTESGPERQVRPQPLVLHASPDGVRPLHACVAANHGLQSFSETCSLTSGKATVRLRSLVSYSASKLIPRAVSLSAEGGLESR